MNLALLGHDNHSRGYLEVKLCFNAVSAANALIESKNRYLKHMKVKESLKYEHARWGKDISILALVPLR
jgi:hypothetical protein